MSKKEIIIIDNYIDKSILDLLRSTNANITIVTNYKNTLLVDYKNQYPVNIIYNYHFHDRFIIIDNSIMYHLGVSLKDAGKKCFAINKIDDKKYLDMIIRLIYKK